MSLSFLTPLLRTSPFSHTFFSHTFLSHTTSHFLHTVFVSTQLPFFSHSFRFPPQLTFRHFPHTSSIFHLPHSFNFTQLPFPTTVSFSIFTRPLPFFPIAISARTLRFLRPHLPFPQQRLRYPNEPLAHHLLLPQSRSPSPSPLISLTMSFSSDLTHLLPLPSLNHHLLLPQSQPPFPSSPVSTTISFFPNPNHHFFFPNLNHHFLLPRPPSQPPSSSPPVSHITDFVLLQQHTQAVGEPKPAGTNSMVCPLSFVAPNDFFSRQPELPCSITVMTPIHFQNHADSLPHPQAALTKSTADKQVGKNSPSVSPTT